MAKALLTTSWDDGHPFDLRLADLLAKYDLPGCFYVPRYNPENEVMDEGTVRHLSQSFEIGGHTIHHIRLTRLERTQAAAEIRECSTWLDDVTGKHSESFCYPGGFYDRWIVRNTAKSFSCARTSDWLCLNPGSDAYRIRPSLHLYPHSRSVHLAHSIRRGHIRSLCNYVTRFGAATDCLDLAKAMASYVIERGGTFHLWGHSWEIDRLQLWSKLEDIFRMLHDMPFTRIDNATLGRLIKEGNG
jgi:peptidoglycan-N-acetylglucosamine deacetylase